MSIKNIREALQAAGIRGGAGATKRDGAGEVQGFLIAGVEVERPAGEAATVSAIELIKALKAP